MVNVLLGVTGSVAAVKTQAIIDELRKLPFPIQLIVILTKGSEMFVDRSKIHSADFIYSDDAEYSPETRWNSKGDPVMHIDLRRWANVLVIAPLTAHTLAKIASGLCDTLLTCVIRAWEFPDSGPKPIVMFPAMNTAMWEHPLTKRHLGIVRGLLHAVVVDPAEGKQLACGDTGPGALPEPSEIAETVKKVIERL